MVSGATGPNAASINGFFDPTSEIHEDRVRYCKRGDASVWIEHFKQGNGRVLWQIKRAGAKGTDSALIFSYGRRALDACASSKWFYTEDEDKDIADEDKYIEMKGVKLQTDAAYKVMPVEA